MGFYLNSRTAYSLYQNEAVQPYFVDKSKMLKDLFPLVKAGNRHICLTRPRRFGKTIMANMIASFFTKACDTKELFDSLAIASEQEYETYRNKKSRQIANGWDVVCMETLDMQGMSRGLHFGKSVYDNGWGMFRSFLKYKLEEQGKRLVEIDRWYPSSKRCHVCGAINETLTLSDRRWKCQECGTEHDRDYNASINIREEGIRMLCA